MARGADDREHVEIRVDPEVHHDPMTMAARQATHRAYMEERYGPIDRDGYVRHKHAAAHHGAAATAHLIAADSAAEKGDTTREVWHRNRASLHEARAAFLSRGDE